MMTLQAITIPGQKKAFVVKDEVGNERGTISQYNRVCEWTAYKGVGRMATLAGCARNRNAAVALVLK